jgi:hypothetical protein
MADEIEIDDADLERLLEDPEDEGDGNDAEPPADWKPPTFAEWKATQDAKVKANTNAKQLRLKFNEYRKQHGPKPGPPPNGQGGQQGQGTGKTEAEIRAELKAEYDAQRSAATVQTEAITALVTAGLQLPKDAGKRTAAARKAIRLMDLDGIDPGDADAIESAIEELREDYPGLFVSAKADEDDEDEKLVRRPRRALGGPGARTTRDNGKPLSNNEQLARALKRAGAFGPAS